MGWPKPPEVPNREFEALALSGNLESQDQRTKLAFISQEILVAFHSNSPLGTPAPSNFLEAFFLDASSGALIRKQSWPTRRRKASNDQRDSESRIIPLAHDSFVVIAQDELLLYGVDGKVIAHEQLASRDFIYGVQPVGNGEGIFVRTEALASPKVKYEWRSAQDLREQREMPGYQNNDFDVRGGVVAGDEFVLIPSGSGLRLAGHDGAQELLCQSDLCLGDNAVRPITAEFVAICGAKGVGVGSTNKNLIWSHVVKQPRTRIQCGNIQPALQGGTFAIWASSARPLSLGASHLEDRPTVIVYRTATGEIIRSIPFQPRSGDFNFALSPEGKRLALFDGEDIFVYSLN